MMLLRDVPHPVIAYRTYGMDSDEHPLLWPVVTYLMIDDEGERVLLFYHPPSNRPDMHALVKAAAKTAAGLAAETWVLRRMPEDLRSEAGKQASNRLFGWVKKDLDRAFHPRRGEGYYRVDDPSICYYAGMIQALP